jgi:hypothetical protein
MSILNALGEGYCSSSHDGNNSDSCHNACYQEPYKFFSLTNNDFMSLTTYGPVKFLDTKI